MAARDGDRGARLSTADNSSELLSESESRVVDHADTAPGAGVEPLRAPEGVPLTTRLLEIFIAAFVLLVTLPLMLCIALIIRWGTPGPALFFQTRVGINKKPFRFVKFRTFYEGSREKFPHLYDYNYSETELANLKFKTDDDPRITPQGRWLRRTSLDELPNFWNVLKGDMTLVGPRPEIPELVPYYKGEMLEMFTVRPGITGRAQTSGRGHLGFYETVAYDVEYVRRRSFLFDLKIILKTLQRLIGGDGAF